MDLFRKSSGRTSGGALRMLFSDSGGIMNATSSKDRRAKLTRILGYDPGTRAQAAAGGASMSGTQTLSTTIVSRHHEVDMADLLEGMRQMMTSQIKRACFGSWKQVLLLFLLLPLPA